MCVPLFQWAAPTLADCQLVWMFTTARAHAIMCGRGRTTGTMDKRNQANGQQGPTACSGGGGSHTKSIYRLFCVRNRMSDRHHKIAL